MRARSFLGAMALAATSAIPPAAAQPGGPPAPAADPADVRPAILRDVGFDQRLGESLPLDVTLHDEKGRSVRLRELMRGRPVVLALVYYDCPMLCTLTLNRLETALEAIAFTAGREFDVLTVSFDSRETHTLAAAKKAAYVGRYGRPEAETGWRFLTGDASDVRRLTQAVGFRYVWDERTRQFAHPSGIVVATPDGRIARYLYGIEYSPKDLRFAVVEAAEGKVGGALDQVALFCYQYDAARGRYSFVAINLVRGAGVLTVAGIAGLIVTLRRRERGR